MAESTTEHSSWHKGVGIGLALSSALFIGSSFVIKKKGLINSNTTTITTTPNNNNIKNQLDYSNMTTTTITTTQPYAYLKSRLWWTGMILMITGEILNFTAYAFAPAIIVTPLGALSVVISSFLSSLILNERLNFAGKVGCFQCIIGSVIIVLHAPEEAGNTSTILEFIGLVVTPTFLSFMGICFIIILILIFYASNKWGTKWPIVYISICSIIGAFVVLATQGIGSAIVYSISNPSDNQFLKWESYIVISFMVICGVLQINYLNKALNIFSTAIVTPIYYVMFTFVTLVAAGILAGSEFSFASALDFLTLCFGFLVIVGGVALLFEYSLKLSRLEQMSKTTGTDGSDDDDDDDVNLSLKGPLLTTSNNPTDDNDDQLGDAKPSSTTANSITNSISVMKVQGDDEKGDSTK